MRGATVHRRGLVLRDATHLGTRAEHPSPPNRLPGSTGSYAQACITNSTKQERISRSTRNGQAASSSLPPSLRCHTQYRVRPELARGLVRSSQDGSGAPLAHPRSYISIISISVLAPQETRRQLWARPHA